MSNLKVKIKRLNPKAILPAYQTEHAAGMDLHACIDEPMIIQPLQRLMVSTGFSLELPVGYEAQIRARSGLSIKNGITMINGIGTIDCDYRGEVCALVVNISDQPFTVEPGMRIAQMIIAKYEKVDWETADSLSQTKRGDVGFGSTGVKSK
jgi:dUTP pyrophosphatase